MYIENEIWKEYLIDEKSIDYPDQKRIASLKASIFARQKKWDQLRNNEMDPLVNKTIAGQFSPGSTFKIISALAGLEAGVIDSDETV